MIIIYDLITFVLIVVYMPVYFLRRKFHAGFMRRFGFIPPGQGFDRPIWVHAVSVGEAVAMRTLVERLRELYPGRQFVFSTVTPTGNTIVRAFLRGNDFLTYLPLDISCIVRRVIGRVRPSLFIAAETELWPNLIMQLRRRDIPVVVANARISDRSLRGYRRAGFLTGRVFNSVSLFCAQSEEDARRLITLGVLPDKIRVTGNLKFDAVASGERIDELALRKSIGLGLQEQFVVAGSTHPGEEELFLEAYQKIREGVCGLKLLIAPRHPERAAEVARLIEKFYFDAVRISTLTGPPQEHRRRVVYILDTVGELKRYYALADVVFVGGSLVKKGGHNILEPAAFGKPVVVGPHMFNFRDIADMFVRGKAIEVVQDKEELHTVISRLLKNPEEAAALGKAAQELMRRNAGATERTAGFIQDVVR